MDVSIYFEERQFNSHHPPPSISCPEENQWSLPFPFPIPVWRKDDELMGGEASEKVSISLRNLNARDYKQIMKQKKIADTKREVGKCL